MKAKEVGVKEKYGPFLGRLKKEAFTKVLEGRLMPAESFWYLYSRAYSGVKGLALRKGKELRVRYVYKGTVPFGKKGRAGPFLERTKVYT